AMGESARLEELAVAPLPERVEPALRVEESEAARFYRSLGLVADAEAKLREALSDAPHEKLAFHLARADVRSAFLVARADRALLRPVEAVTWWIWEAAYPRPHREAIAALAARAGIPEAWVYATMRQESGFHAEARSRSGAEGLLQIMPQVAAGVAASLGLDLARASLTDPEVNAALGVELDLFVARVPFEETRRYVKRVVSHYFVYRYLAGEADPFEGAIPEKVERP